MDNKRFDSRRFSQDELPDLEQLQREQSFAARNDVDFPPEYARQDFRQPYAPQPGYAPGYPYAQQPSYAPGYPYATGYPQPDMMRGYEMPMQQPYMPQHATYTPQHAAYAPPYADPHAFGQYPGYENPAPRQTATPYYADDPNYRPQHMSEPQQPYPEDPSYGYYGRDVFAGQPPKAEQADSFSALPSLAELQQALQAERQAEAQRAMEVQQRERAAMQQQMQQPPVRSDRESDRTPDYPAGQAPKRFVIEDLEPDGDEESHTKKKDLPPEEKSQFASLLRRFRPKNS